MPVEVVDSGGSAAAALVAPAKRAGEHLLDCLALYKSELCILLTTDDHIRELNSEWRGKEAATDVLSFSQVVSRAPEDDARGHDAPSMLGDVVISVDTLERQAAAGGWSNEEELVRLILHGLLHLLGHDHEKDEEAQAMRTEEGRLVALLRERGIGCAWEEA